MTLATALRIVRHPVRALDSWWTHQAPKHRLDRGPSYLVLLVPVWLYSLSVLLVGPVPKSTVDELPVAVQYAVMLVIFGGSTGQLVGSLLGSRFVKPHFDTRRSYRIGYSAAPMTAMGLFAYGWAVVHDTPNWTSAFGGLVGPAIGLGALINAVLFVAEARRLDRIMRHVVDIRQAAGES
jgi:hypothetical protein